ncbi:hypothetical protein PPL_03988 [Heterostelium album PN500]|uniref:FAD-binding PCMH-type domain-containing protein n=1 Tax=Heterostelium pallidum (strain ATCC 26659 / Pp 5 / PN500) TaxID=670386 RepID=D3B5Q0_HETP5|nr:hypothetical protein PPL_03988 [Heterostelium album PN500]EFA83198.1 hypothetical protein PPL_03988 [Heterostelium album PN500]|eukprot:XP_020435315.1 hypothetical protein PPL_03988 [Heterostelium album PN500]
MKSTIILFIVGMLVVCNALTLTQLKAQLSGKVIGQRDPGYNDVRTGYNSRYSRLPTLIVQPYNTADVVLALEYAQSNGLQVSVKSGGHSASLLSVLDDRVVIDFSQMKGKTFDNASMTITAQPGNRWVDFYNYSINTYGVATPGGNCPSVGIGGLSLGGGANELASVYGAAVDNILEIEIVLANRSVVTASATTNPDLFWALRGAGHQSYGVVTQLKYRVYNIRPTYYSAWITYKWADFEKVLYFVGQYSKTMPNDVNLYFTGWRSGNATTPSVALSCFSNGLPENGESLCGVFRNISGAVPLSFDFTVQSYYTTVSTGSDPKARRSYTKNTFLRDLTPLTIRTIRRSLEASPISPFNYNTARLNLYWTGGAVLDKPRNYTAFVHRTYPWNAVWLSSWASGDKSDAYHDWILGTYGAMRLFSVREAYQNYQDDELRDWEQLYYAENYPQLRVIKSKYDPMNYFSYLQSVRPVGAEYEWDFY